MASSAIWSGEAIHDLETVRKLEDVVKDTDCQVCKAEQGVWCNRNNKWLKNLHKKRIIKFVQDEQNREKSK
jgi:hypothetical protein